MDARPTRFVGLDNYRYTVDNPDPLLGDTHSALLTTLLWLIAYPLGVVLLGLAIAILASRVRCVADEECDRIFPNQFPAVLRARLKSGDVRETRVSHNRGGPENPLSDEELEIKFRSNAGRVLSGQAVDELGSALQALEGSGDVGEVMRLARG